MLKRHFDFIEKLILAQSKVVYEAGHSIHKGTPREFLIREFLEKHIGERAAFGTGEIIDSEISPSILLLILSNLPNCRGFKNP